jgi:hypothetical protein
MFCDGALQVRTFRLSPSAEPIRADRLLRRIAGALAMLGMVAGGMGAMADWATGRVKSDAGHAATSVAGYRAGIARAPDTVITSRPFDLAQFRLEDFGDVDGGSD